MAHDKPRQQVNKVPLEERLYSKEGSNFRRYQDFFLGDRSLSRLLIYELVTVSCASFPGAAGYWLRKHFFSALFHQVGRNVLWGRGISLRCARNMTIGDRVAVDDLVLLDASGGDLHIGHDVMIARSAIVQAKNGPIRIGDNGNIGSRTILSSASGIYLGRHVLMAGNCYIGGARYGLDRCDIPIMNQPAYSKGPVQIGDDVWLGAGATILDGAKIGSGAVIGAGAVVTGDIPDGAIAAGVPARVMGSR